jgi:hypothetical protein
MLTLLQHACRNKTCSRYRDIAVPGPCSVCGWLNVLARIVWSR